MSIVTAQEVQKYLDEEGYMSLEEIAIATDTTPEKIRALEKAECIPATSYVVGGDMTFKSSFGTYRLPIEEDRYYHPSIAKWIARALSLAESRCLDDVAKTVREEFNVEFLSVLDGSSPPWPRGADYAWDFIVDGTWGLCLKDITVENLLTKERARATIRDIANQGPNHQLTETERLQLQTAIAEFEKVALPFAPHEVADSCRNSEIRPAIKKYDLGVQNESGHDCGTASATPKSLHQTPLRQ